ncbi:MAG: hypothetical protein ACI845_001686 [Gammaproteobacteria bacterium]|jgi:hypothetical protein
MGSSKNSKFFVTVFGSSTMAPKRRTVALYSLVTSLKQYTNSRRYQATPQRQVGLAVKSAFLERPLCQARITNNNMLSIRILEAGLRESDIYQGRVIFRFVAALSVPVSLPFF